MQQKYMGVSERNCCRQKHCVPQRRQRRTRGSWVADFAEAAEGNRLSDPKAELESECKTCANI